MATVSPAQVDELHERIIAVRNIPLHPGGIVLPEDIPDSILYVKEDKGSFNKDITIHNKYGEPVTNSTLKNLIKKDIKFWTAFPGYPQISKTGNFTTKIYNYGGKDIRFDFTALGVYPSVKNWLKRKLNISNN